MFNLNILFMKKINILMLGVLVLFAGFFASCKKDAATNDATISLAGDVGYTATDATVTGGGTFKIKWTATSSTDMGYITIAQDNSAYVGWNEKVIASGSKSTYIDEATITVPASGGPYTYSIIIYGTGTNSIELARKDIVITIGATTAKLNFWTGTLAAQLGASGSSIGSSYATSTNSVYTSNTVGSYTANVDFYYFYSTSASVYAEIISPFYAGGTGGISSVAGWATQNATKFGTTSVTATEFDNIVATDESLVVSSATSLTADKVVTLAVGNVFAFQTAAGKKGLAKVKILTTGDTGSITIEVKVQK
jgi:hypothetical protein